MVRLFVCFLSETSKKQIDGVYFRGGVLKSKWGGGGRRVYTVAFYTGSYFLRSLLENFQNQLQLLYFLVV